MGIKEGMMEEGKEMKIEEDRVIEGRIKIDRKKWKIIGMYVKESRQVSKEVEKMDGGKKGGGVCLRRR